MKQNLVSGVYGNECTSRENDRRDMIISFILGVILSFFYACLPHAEWLVDVCYLLFLLIVYIGVSTPGIDVQQELNSRKVSLWLTAIVALAMWSVFIMDADSIYVHKVLSVGGYSIGDEVHLKSFTVDYINYGQVLCDSLMVVCAFLSVCMPLQLLYKLRND